jgi:hypothetical protein
LISGLGFFLIARGRGFGGLHRIGEKRGGADADGAPSYVGGVGGLVKERREFFVGGEAFGFQELEKSGALGFEGLQGAEDFIDDLLDDFLVHRMGQCGLSFVTFRELHLSDAAVMESMTFGFRRLRRCCRGKWKCDGGSRDGPEFLENPKWDRGMD